MVSAGADGGAASACGEVLRLMWGASFDIGQNLTSVLTILAVAVSAWLGTRRAAKPIQDEFSNNGGSTMRDAIDRIERTVTEVRAEQIAIKARVDALEAKKGE